MDTKSYAKALEQEHKSIERAVKYLNVRMAFLADQTIRRHLTRVKTPRDQYKTKGVVYSIPCECGRVYIGETVKQGISEHKRAVKNQDKNNGIAVHVLQTGHEIESAVKHREQQWTGERGTQTLEP